MHTPTQSLSTLALKPKYASQETHIRFQVPQSLQNMCLSAGLPAELHQDLLFLYIRPHTQGRGKCSILNTLSRHVHALHLR